jgi:2-oxoacid:acceptor oxidoreductase gamma subunit (pyruvate/2-ketoisovalerate family)
LLEIRIHGRGGQGAVVASRLLALAFFKEGQWVQSFPTFGAERRGAPVAAFTRTDNEPITLRCGITKPDILVVLDSTLLGDVDVTNGLKEGGEAIVNSSHSLDLKGINTYTVDASAIALEHGLGTSTYPIVNTAMVGAFAGATKLVGIGSVVEAIKEFVKDRTRENVEAAREAWSRLK